MTLATLEARTYDALGWDATNPGTVAVRRLRGFLNDTYRELIGRKGFDQYRRQYVPFYSVANSPFATLPQAVTRVYSVVDPLNYRRLDDAALIDIRQHDPGLQSTGRPSFYATFNLNSAVFAQPSTASSMYVASTSAGDTTPVRVYIEGMTGGGFLRQASVVITGVTPVAIGTTTNWTHITKFYIQIPSVTGLGALTAAVGTISLMEMPAAIPISYIGPGKDRTHYSQLQLYPTPTSVITYMADADLRVEDLVEEGDEPILPEDYHWLLSSGAIMKEYRRREKPVQHAEEKARYKDGLDNLILYTNRLPGRNKLAQSGHSTLGAMYPAGS